MSYHQKWLDKKIIDKKIPDYKRVGWNSRNSQIIRMKILSEIVESGNSVLDVGCGMGKFHGYLLEKGISHRYTGIDLMFQSLFSWNLLLMSGFFSFFFPFDTVKPPILSPPLA